MVNSFSSEKYKSFAVWQKVIFWFGILSFLHPAYWIVRLILYLVARDEPLKKRVNFYTTQTYIFGWINVIVLAILIIILTILAIFAGLAAMWLVPTSVVTSP